MCCTVVKFPVGSTFQNIFWGFKTAPMFPCIQCINVGGFCSGGGRVCV